jgi:hypothetical protein
MIAFNSDSNALLATPVKRRSRLMEMMPYRRRDDGRWYLLPRSQLRTVSLSKSLRDDQEAARMINKIEEARTEKLLMEINR